MIGLITSVYGVICAIGTERLRRFVGFMVLSSVGTILVAISMHEYDCSLGRRPVLYDTQYPDCCSILYPVLAGLPHSAVQFKDHFKIAPLMKQNKLVSITYFIIALMMAGLPPFSGFFGKVFILQASANSEHQIGSLPDYSAGEFPQYSGFYSSRLYAVLALDQT